jgi:hypothetical protein
MWFEKWFGKAEDRQQDDEPARFSAPQPTQQSTKVNAPGAAQGKSAGRIKPKNGFDPYNSGAFERKNAWERTNLR